MENFYLFEYFNSKDLNQSTQVTIDDVDDYIFSISFNSQFVHKSQIIIHLNK